MEKMTVCPNTNDDYNILISKIKQIDKKLNLVSRLSALSVAIKHTGNKFKTKGYYILQLNYKNKLLRINNFPTNQVEIATNVYNQIEALNNPDIDVVLVSATSFDTLKAAYPNYFTDISEFVDIMRNILA